jgi:hypothetical protein
LLRLFRVGFLPQKAAQVQCLQCRLPGGEIVRLPGPQRRKYVSNLASKLDIGFKRLDAYPTAKRCIACQERRERTRAPSPYTGR